MYEPTTKKRSTGQVAVALCLLLVTVALFGIVAKMMAEAPGLESNEDYQMVMGAVISPAQEPDSTRSSEDIDYGTRTADVVMEERETQSVEEKTPETETPPETIEEEGDDYTVDSPPEIESQIESATSEGVELITPEDFELEMPEMDSENPIELPMSLLEGIEEVDTDEYDTGIFLEALTEEGDDPNCTKTVEFDFDDADGDGNPEWVEVRILVVCEIDENEDGYPEVKAVFARNINLWDNDSDGKFNALVGLQGVHVALDPNSDGLIEYEALGLWRLVMQDPEGDETPNYVSLEFVGKQELDADTDGNLEFRRYFWTQAEIKDETNNGIAEELHMTLV
ncbi:MAG: hypothetical protein V3V98_04475, partial [Thermoplasmata archaeon]